MMFFVTFSLKKGFYENSIATLYCDTFGFFLVSDNMIRNDKSVAVSQSVMSDHKIVSLSLFNVPNKRGNGYWKVNNSILLDVNYITQIKQVISDFIVTNAQEDMSPHTLWETLKCIIRGETIKFCVCEKKIEPKAIFA